MRVGGMAKTIELWGQRVDLGPHRYFSNERRINELWLEVMESDYSMVDRLTRIYYRKRFFLYPLRIRNVIANLGILESATVPTTDRSSAVQPEQRIFPHVFATAVSEIFFCIHGLAIVHPMVAVDVTLRRQISP